MLATGSAAALAGLSDRTLAELIRSLGLLGAPSAASGDQSAPLVEKLAKRLADANDALIGKQLAEEGSAPPGHLAATGLCLRNIFSQRGASPLTEVESFFQLELQYAIDQGAAISLADNFSGLVVLCFGGITTAWSPLVKSYAFAGVAPIIASALISSPSGSDGTEMNLCSFEFFVRGEGT